MEWDVSFVKDSYVSVVSEIARKGIWEYKVFSWKSLFYKGSKKKD